MPTTRPRWIVRSAVMAGVLLLLPLWYLGGVTLLLIGITSGILPARTAPIVNVYCKPLFWYGSHEELPGGAACERLMEESIEFGGRIGQQ